LLRYDAHWPQREFWLAGEPQVAELPNNVLRVSFPLRYRLRNHTKSASGEVRKTLVLRQARGSDLEIVSVNEDKMKSAE